jgi:hypothetical protein
MKLRVDSDLQSVVEFMQANIPTSKLLATAEAVALLGPVIWSHHERNSVAPAMLVSEPISLGDLHRQPSSNEPLLAQ